MKKWWQDKELTRQLIRWYGRRQLKRELQQIHKRLLTGQPDSPLALKIRKAFPEKGL